MGKSQRSAAPSAVQLEPPGRHEPADGASRQALPNRSALDATIALAQSGAVVYADAPMVLAALERLAIARARPADELVAAAWGVHDGCVAMRRRTAALIADGHAEAEKRHAEAGRLALRALDVVARIEAMATDVAEVRARVLGHKGTRAEKAIALAVVDQLG